MRRLALALIVSALAVSPALAQSQTTPPPPTPPTPPTPPAAPPAPAPRLSVTLPAPAVSVQTPRTGQAPTVVTAERSNLGVFNRSTPASWQNIRLEVAISDSLAPDQQHRKSVSMLILDGLSGQVRSSAGEGLINIDARPTIRPDGRIWIQLTIEYRPELSGQQLQQAGLNRMALFTESLSLLVADGKPVLVSQSADPRSDRKVSVEVTAGVIK